MGGGASAAQNADGSITRWLEEQNEAFRKYAKLFIEAGYDDVSFLLHDSDRAEVEVLLLHDGGSRVKKPHARRILKAYDALLASSADVVVASTVVTPVVVLSVAEVGKGPPP